MSTPPLRITVTADLHFGNPRIDHVAMYDHLVHTLYPVIATSHLFVCAGDTFDSLLSIATVPTMYAFRFFEDLIELSNTHGTQIRILHGTFSHDRKQILAFDSLLQGLKKHKDPTITDRIRIVTAMETEEITTWRCDTEQFTRPLRVAYLPDSLPYKQGEEAVRALTAITEVVGWDTVDFLVGHGTFDFMMPKDVPLPPCTYTVDMFSSLVEGPIVMGHIHNHGSKKNVVYAGSFERMAHNEEGPKGFLVLTGDADGTWKTTFKQNKEATRFISIHPEGTEMDDIIKSYHQQVTLRFPTGEGYVRVLHHDPEVRSTLSAITASQYPQLHYSAKTTGGEIPALQLKTQAAYLREVNDAVIPTVDNLPTLVYEYIKNHATLHDYSHSLTQEHITRICEQTE